MNSSNPILTRSSVVPSSQPMTVNGAVSKSLTLVGVAALTAVGIFAFAPGAASLAAITGMIGSLVLGLIIAFKQNMAKPLALPFAIAEGLLMGGASVIYSAAYGGVVLPAVAATVVSAFTMLTLYKTGVIRATETFKSVILSATVALMILFLIQLVMRLAFGSSIPLLFGNGPIATGFAAFVAILASLNLILDFDLIERAEEMGAPRDFEWVAGTAVLSTLVWMYISFLRLLGILQSSD